MATAGYGLQNDAAARGKIQSSKWNTAMDAIQVIGEVFGKLGGEGFIEATDFNATAVGTSKLVDVSAGYGIILKDGVYVAIHQPDAQTNVAIVGTTASPQTNYGYIDPDGLCTVVQNPANAPADSHLAWTCTCTDSGASAIDNLPDGRQNLLSMLATRVSADDEQAGYLSTKIVAGTNVTATVLNNGADETLSIAAPNLVSDTGDNLTGALTFTRSLSTEGVVNSKVTGDANLRFDLEASGRMDWGNGTDPGDTNLYRSAASILKTDDKFVTVAGLGVGNSAAATALGSVTRKIEVFDASGASLGFVPVYDTIT